MYDLLAPLTMDAGPPLPVEAEIGELTASIPVAVRVRILELAMQLGARGIINWVERNFSRDLRSGAIEGVNASDVSLGNVRDYVDLLLASSYCDWQVHSRLLQMAERALSQRRKDKSGSSAEMIRFDASEFITQLQAEFPDGRHAYLTRRQVVDWFRFAITSRLRLRVIRARKQAKLGNTDENFYVSLPPKIWEKTVAPGMLDRLRAGQPEF